MSQPGPQSPLLSALTFVLRSWSGCCTVVERMGVLRSQAFLRAFVLIFAGGMAAACGDSSDGSDTVELRFNFTLNRAGQQVRCTDTPEVDRVEVMLFLADGVTLWPGFPMDADCDASTFIFPGLRAGEYVVQLQARGPLDGDPDAVLFRQVQSIVLPVLPTLPLTIELEPEVAFLELSWTFGEDGLARCANEVGAIQVIVATPGGQTGAFSTRLDCTGPLPVRLPRPFAPQEYIIQVEALSPVDNLRLFQHTVQRFLVRGENPYLAVLEPLGGRLNFDWQFAVAQDTFTDCDAPVVDVSSIVIQVSSREGGGGVDEAVAACTDAPYAFLPNRYTQGRLLAAELTAEGMHTFVGEQLFTMPDGDYDSGRITLHAVGTATLATTVQTATCAEGLVVGYEVNIDGPGPVSGDFDTFGPPTSSVALSRLRYGEYDVEIVQLLDGGAAQCSARGLRRIDARANDWDVFAF